MSKDIIYFAENVCGLNLTETQKEILHVVQNSNDRGEKVFLSYGRKQGIGLLKNILYSFETWLKDQRIAELEEQLANSIRPKFKIGQEVWFINETLEVMHNGKINAFEMYKFKDRPYEFWYDIDYVDGNTEYSDEVSDEVVFATKEEAQAKLEEITAKNV
jgi:hypothetical protein